MGVTPIFNLPYPDDSNGIDYVRDHNALVNAMQDVLTAALPESWEHTESSDTPRDGAKFENNWPDFRIPNARKGTYLICSSYFLNADKVNNGNVKIHLSCNGTVITGSKGVLVRQPRWNVATRWQDMSTGFTLGYAHPADGPLHLTGKIERGPGNKGGGYKQSRWLIVRLGL